MRKCDVDLLLGLLNYHIIVRLCFFSGRNGVVRLLKTSFKTQDSSV